MQNASKKILLLDYCSEKNRGDAAMQVGLIHLVEKYFPKSKITVLTVFGANQIADIKDEYDHTVQEKVTLVGGLKPTYYPLKKEESRSELHIELLNATSFFFSLYVLLLVFLRVPKSIVLSLIPRQYRKSLSAIYEADIVIWNGRNFRSRNNKILELYRMYNLVFHPLISIFLSKKMACLGASVWKLNSSFTQSLLRFAFSNCFFISIREERSFKEAKNLMGKKYHDIITLLPDLSFAAFEKMDTLKRSSISKTDPQQVGFTLVDWKSDGKGIRDNYKSVMQECITTFLNRGAKVFLIPQVTKKWENFDEIYDDILSAIDPKLKKNITLYKNELMMNELIEAYSRLDLLVATRMHSAIFSASIGTPVVAVSYDSGGKWAILEKLGLKDYIIPYSKVSTELLNDRIDSCWKNRKTLLEMIRTNVLHHRKEVEKNVSIIKEYTE